MAFFIQNCSGTNRLMTWDIKKFSELTTNELYEIIRLRSEVFVVEQNCVYQDLDGKDQESIHVCGYNKNLLVAYARIVNKGVSYSEISIGRVVVSEKSRGNDLGKELMKFTIQFITNELGVQPIRISAQSYLENFYSQLGFNSTGKSYLEDGIPHLEMLLPV